MSDLIKYPPDCEYIVDEYVDYEEYASMRSALTRTGHIGGSMAGAVLGLSTFMTQYKAWLMLTGQYEQPEPKEHVKERMWIGRCLESTVRDMASEKIGIPVIDWNGILQSKDRPWQIYSPDAFLVLLNGEPVLVEIKTVGFSMAKLWSSGSIADIAHAQLLHGLAVTGFKRGLVIALIANQSLEIRWVDRDDDLIGEINRREQEMIDMVNSGNTPPITENDSELINDLHKPEDVISDCIDLPRSAWDLISTYRQASAYAKEAWQMKEAAANNLKNMLGDHESGVIDNFVVQWKTVRKKGYVVEESEHRRLSIKG